MATDTRRTRVYVASPYTGDTELNTRRAIDTADALLLRGYAPFVPHLSHFWNMRHEHDYETWLAWCLEWVPTCDVLLRLDGVSRGADREVALALNGKLNVYHSLDTLCACEPATRAV